MLASVMIHSPQIKVPGKHWPQLLLRLHSGHSFSKTNFLCYLTHLLLLTQSFTKKSPTQGYVPLCFLESTPSFSISYLTFHAEDVTSLFIRSLYSSTLEHHRILEQISGDDWTRILEAGLSLLPLIGLSVSSFPPSSSHFNIILFHVLNCLPVFQLQSTCNRMWLSLESRNVLKSMWSV